jgi:hypothetical protein
MIVGVVPEGIPQSELLHIGTLTGMSNFSDLETKGFIVIKNFFSDSLIGLLREDYQKQYQQSSWNKNKNYQTLSISSVDWKIENSIKSILDDI